MRCNIACQTSLYKPTYKPVYYNYSIGRTGPQPACYDIHRGVNNASAEVDFLWNFQYCSEIFQVASRDGVRDMFFDQPWNGNASALGCARNTAYGGVAPRQRWLTTFFGGRHLTEASNIVFSNGKLDPWARQGVLPANGTGRLRRTVTATGLVSSAAGLGPGSAALLIDRAAHHLDLFFSHADDPASVVGARAVEMEHVAQWIAQKRERVALRRAATDRDSAGSAALW